MRCLAVMLILCGMPPLLLGCGGGLSQEDMRRHAIRRPSDDSSDEVAQKTKPSAAKSDTRPEVQKEDATGKQTTDLASEPPTTDVQVPGTAESRPPVDSSSLPSASPGAGSKNLSSTISTDRASTELNKPLGLIERRQRTIDNMTRIGEAVRRYCEDHGRLFARAMCNPKGEPLLSWRVELLPYLGYQALYNKFDIDEPWDSARNKPLLKLIPDVYRSPERYDEKTNYMVPVSSFTAFGRSRGIGIRGIEDGMENTVLLLEVDDSAAIPWTQPVDYSINLRTFDAQVGSLREDGFLVVWGDGSVTRVTPQRSASDLKAIFSFDGGDMFTSHLVRASAEATPAIDIVKPTTDVSAEGTEKPVTGRAAEPAAMAATDPGSRRAASAKPLSPERLPIPDARKLSQARNLVREIYENEYKNARSARDQQALAKSMLKQVDDMPDDAAGQYVMLDIVIQIATVTKDSATAIAAMEAMRTRFDVDDLEIEHGILEQLAKRKDRGRAVNQALLDQAAPLIEIALQKERFETAESLCQIALGAARQLEDNEQEADLEMQKKLVEEARTAYRTIHRVIANLEDADDPEVNLDVGRYYCLIHGNWEKGLPMLAKGAHAKLRQLAVAELRGPTEPTDQLELADGWWQLGAEEKSHQKVLRLHAAHWYLRAMDSLPQGLLKVKADLRVTQVEREYGKDVLASLTRSE